MGISRRATVLFARVSLRRLGDLARTLTKEGCHGVKWTVHLGPSIADVGHRRSRRRAARERLGQHRFPAAAAAEPGHRRSRRRAARERLGQHRFPALLLKSLASRGNSATGRR
jgi:hypothetical protein